jgi:hypothetical protein
MSFWDLANLPENGHFDMGGGDMEPIPANTTCLANIDEAKWATDRDGNSHIAIRWSILQPSEYKNRKVFQKLWVNGDPKVDDAEKNANKAKKAKLMLAVIDMNAGGKLRAAGVDPTDEMMSKVLTGVPMMIKIMQWSQPDRETGQTRIGNWIGAVSARNGSAPPPAAGKPAKTEATSEVPF